MTQLLAWVDDPRTDRGLRFLDDRDGWKFHSFASLAERSYGVAAILGDAGVAQGDVVCIFLPTSEPLVAAIFGTWIAGGTISALVPPSMFDDEELYILHVSRILRTACPTVVATDATYYAFVERAVAASGLDATVVLDVTGRAEHALSPRRRGSVALLQFTSGSSGTPRGVRVSFESLVANIDSIRRWIRMGADDVTATWLPLYHDMGLIGCLLTPSVNASDVWVMRPDQFVRDPGKWLECFGRERASLCASPNFGYGYAARKVSMETLGGCDFSHWRVAIAGAEPVDAGALTLFSEAFGPFGFSNRAFLPAYGLAEATLAVTGSSPNVVARAVQLDWDNLLFGAAVDVLSVSEIGALNHENSLGWLVGSGRPHPGIEVRIVGADGGDVPSGTLGEIFVSGESVALGYTGGEGAGATRFVRGGILTGDAGFLYDGELFVVGRMADSIKIRGRSVYADDLEARLAAGTGIRRGRCVVVARPSRTGGAILAIGECVDAEWSTRAGKILKSYVGEDTPVRVLTGPRGVIRRTSSGKPRRRLMWELDSSGELEADVVDEY